MHRQVTLALTAAALFAAFVGGWIVNGWRLKGELQRQATAYAQNVTAAVEKAREEDNRRTKALVEALDAAQQDLIVALTDRDRARTASDSLRERARAVATTCSNPAAAGTSAAAKAAGDLLADVLGRIDEAAGDIAAHADRAVIAGTACERAYDSLGK
jgi:hypothetical protein